MTTHPLHLLLARSLRENQFGGEGGWIPAVDVYETGTAAVIVAELPGLRREDIEVTVGEGSLTISGQRPEFIPPDAIRLHNLEIDRGRFSRGILVPAGFDLEKVQARMEGGLLFITLPRRPKRVVPIEDGE